jgi:serine protease Do
VEDANSLTIQVIQMAPGSVAHLDVIRNGNPTKVDVTLGTRPSEDKEGHDFTSQSPGGGGANGLDGVSVETLTPDIAQQIGVPASTKGVVVDSVDQDSPAAEAGLQRGDVIVQVNRQPVANEKDYNRLVQQAKGSSILLLVNGGGGNHFVVVPSK